MENKIVLYTNKDGSVELRADVEKDTLWATQEQIATVFEVSSQNVTMHLRNIFRIAELNKDSVCKESLHTGRDGKQYLTKFYNLDAIIAVGYRVNSKKATQFRIWATSVLRNYLIKGYSLNQRTLITSTDSLSGLDEAITLMKSKEYPGKLKGKIDIRVTKHLEP